jgi:hypothetical protein
MLRRRLEPEPNRFAEQRKGGAVTPTDAGGEPLARAGVLLVELAHDPLAPAEQRPFDLADGDPARRLTRSPSASTTKPMVRRRARCSS